VFSEGALESFPASFISSMYIEDGDTDILRELQINFPTVSVVDLDPILEQVRQIIEKISLAIQIVFLFTLIAGVTVLFSAVHSTIDERRFESALLRAVGMKKKNVLVSLLSEFSAIGLAAGVLAATGSSVLAWQIASRLFEITYIFNLSLWALGISSGVGLVCGFGYLASRKAIESPPINVLRNN
jgi:putative ABC transport system permease protein